MNAVSTASALTGRRKAAIFMLMLPSDVAAQVLKYLNEDDVAPLLAEMMAVGNAPNAERESVLKEFGRSTVFGGSGGMSYYRELLQGAVGPQRAEDMLAQLMPKQSAMFDRMRRARPEQIAAVLADEHPQAAALALSYLPSDVAGRALQNMPASVKADLAHRIARAQPVSPELLRRVEHSLEKKIVVVMPLTAEPTGGVKALVDIITRVDRDSERAILGELEKRDPSLVDEVKALLFVFDDLLMLSDATLQRVLRDVEHKVVATALKGAQDDVREKMLRNLSQRAQEVVKEEMELMGATRVRDVENARRAIVAVVRALEESGEITVVRGEEELVV
jgi:flagellar motor switch protein FliG